MLTLEEKILPKIISYIKKIDPDYKYKEKDFRLITDDSINVKIVNWQLKSIHTPTQEDIDEITAQEVAEVERKKKVFLKVQIFESLDDVDEPEEGNLVFSTTDKGLYIYHNSTWNKV